MMAAVFAAVVGVLFAGGVYLILRARTFPVVLGLTLLGYAVNLFLFASGRLTPDSAPLTIPGITGHPDPLPQALVLTAIVIGFGMTAFTITLAVRARSELGSDHVDGDTDPVRAGQEDDQ